MSKQDFINGAEAPRSLAEAAWESSGGNEIEANELLEPAKLRIKVKFMASNGRFGGLIFIVWSFIENGLEAATGIVSSDDGVLEIPIDLSPDQFGERVVRANKTGPKMGGNTETLQSALSESLQGAGTELKDAIQASNPDKIELEIGDLLTNNLDLTQPQLTIDIELSRRIQEQEGEATESAGGAEQEGDEEYVVPAEVEIDPVKGVPVNQISIGDLIYVDLGNYPSRLQKIANVLNKRRDDSGLIPAQLISREVSEADTLALRVQFGRGVYGKIRCGKDVNILVPASTAAGKSQGMQKGGSDPLKVITENWVIIFAVIMALIIILVVFLILTA